MDYYEQIKFNEIYLPAREERFQQWIAPNGTYQIALPIAAALFGLGKRERVVDVGANVGLISRVFSILYEEVIAFEPSPQNRACLSRNLAPEFNNVVIYPYALGSSEARSWINETSSNCGGDALVQTDMSSSSSLPGCKPVVVKTLDKILKGDRFSALKIDVQGGELDVLRGGERVIQENKPIILVESEGKSGDKNYDNSKEIDEVIGKLGYKARISLGAKDYLYLHKSSTALKGKVVEKTIEITEALYKKYFMTSAGLNDILADVNRESERIKSLFGI